MKKRIFLCNEASFLKSGYGIHGHELLKRLHNSGKYEVAELGCFASTDDPRIQEIPWKFYPNLPKKNNTKELAVYKNNPLNQYGLWRFNKCIAHFKPHIVFDVRDYWMYSYQETSPFRKYFNWVIMPTVDSAPQQTEWLYTFCNADLVVPYTEWAKYVLRSSCLDKINLHDEPALAGINPEEYYPLKDKESHKEQIFGQKNLLITGLVLRNQKRKLIADILIAYKKYLNGLLISGKNDIYERSYLYLHTTYPEENGWNIPSLLLEFGMMHKTYFTYSCRICEHITVSKFQNSIIKCPKCNNLSCSLPNPASPITTDKLNNIYNLFDLYIQYAICEGFGFPQIEAASCGIPFASVNYSAMTEICENLGGIKIPVKRMFREMETNADRAYPDIDATAKILYDYFINLTPETFKQQSEQFRMKCINKYTWDKVYEVWDRCFDSIDISTKKSWNSNEPDTVGQVSLPNNLSRYEFIKYVCDNIINEPELFYSSHIQNLLKDFYNGIVAKNGSIGGYGQKEVIEILELHLNSKLSNKDLRLNTSSLEQEDYILCQKQKQ